jgi:hypothetical protein
MGKLYMVKKLLIGTCTLFGMLSLTLLLPARSLAATLSNASATLENPRLSYRAGTETGTAGTSTVVIDNSASDPDPDTHHLFPGDTVCFTEQYPAGCLGNTNYTVAGISADDTFSTTVPLTNNIDADGYAIATQSGDITIAFTLVSDIPIGGDIFITIPVADTGNVNDGFPDMGTSNTTDGFDFNRLEPTSVIVTNTGGTCAGGWDTAVVASDSGTITVGKATSPCSGATITVVVPNLVNPSPFIGAHTQGEADAYKIAIETRDAGNNTLDTTNTVVAPVEGVLVSATIEQTLALKVEGTAASSSHCNVSTDVTTYPYSVPWGTIIPIDTFLNAAQKLTVSTNASSGYAVTIEENDQMGLNGTSCTGAAPGGDGFTFGVGEFCIKDTTCDNGVCTNAVTDEWDTGGFNGLGYSLASVSSNPAAVFYYGEESRSFSSRHLADQENGQPKQNIMTGSSPVSSDIIDVCYRISVSGTQPAGYYYNTVKYTATARF